MARYEILKDLNFQRQPDPSQAGRRIQYPAGTMDVLKKGTIVKGISLEQAKKEYPSAFRANGLERALMRAARRDDTCIVLFVWAPEGRAQGVRQGIIGNHLKVQAQSLRAPPTQSQIGAGKGYVPAWAR